VPDRFFQNGNTPTRVPAAFFMVVGTLILLGLGVLSRFLFPFFHTITEILSITVAWGAALLLFSAHRHLNRGAFLILATAFMAAGAVDILHIVSYRGLALLHGHHANVSAQFWILGRLLETMGWAATVAFLPRRQVPRWPHGVLALSAVLGVLSILVWDNFPICFRDDTGLTLFKIGTEFLIIAVSLGAMVFVYRARAILHPQVWPSIVGALATAALAELAFTLYTDPFGISNSVGHLLRLISRFLVFRVFIESGLNLPLAFFFQRLREDNELLVQSEERWRILTESSPDHILDLDPDLNIRFLNYTAPGLTQDDLIGHNLLDFLPADERERIRGILEGVLHRGGTGHYENRHDLPDGGYIQYETTAVARKDTRNRPVGLTLVARDITDRHFTLLTAQARLRVGEYAIGHTLEEMLTKVLDEAEQLTASRLGFFHFVEADEGSLQPPVWSTGTRSLMNGHTEDFRAMREEIWNSCVHRREPHIHNQLALGRPEWSDHPGPVIEREMVLPIHHDQRLVGILGVGNKAEEYSPADLNHLQEFAGQIWPLIAAKQLEARLQTAEDYLARTLAHLPGMVFRCEYNQDWTMRFLSPGCRDLTGYAVEELVDDRVASFNSLIHPGDQQRVRLAVDAGLDRHEKYQVTYRIIPRNQPTKWVWEQGMGIFEQNKLTAIEGFIYDITDQVDAQNERQALERKVLQAQKLESLGVLAGGIAHDFNNLLQAIMGYAEVGLLDLPEGHVVTDSLGQVLDAAQRASGLTAQMLAFSGQGHFHLAAVDLSREVEGMAQLLRSSISKRVQLVMDLAANLPPVSVDQAQLQQVIMNLLTNASEAAEEQDGRIFLATGVIQADQKLLDSNQISFDPEESSPRIGHYGYIEIRDNGCGMDEKTRQRMFEPFFTTKFTGRGLGMAAVQGIMRGHQGILHVASEPGEGTTVRVMFPTSGPVPGQDEPSGTPTTGQGQKTTTGRTILVVDDEQQVREYASRVLRTDGYQTLTARDGQEGAELFEEKAETIGCVLLDLVMPRMDGRECLDALRRIRPDLPVILLSGFAQDEIERRFENLSVAAILPKPFHRAQLLDAIEQCLPGQPGK